MKTMFAITHVNKDGMRTLTFCNQGRNHYATHDEAERALAAFVNVGDLRRKVLHEMADTLAVREVECYDHGDAVRVYFPDRWRLHFRGRQVGAIGIFSNYTIEVSAMSEEDARLAAYETHEHIQFLKIERL